MKILGAVYKRVVITLFILISTVLASLIFLSILINKEKPKVLIIGLDGASWKIITPMMDEGKLPNMKHLLEEGVWGKLSTFEPAWSDIIWTTVATGKPPELHGIVSYLIPDPYSQELIPPTSSMRKVKAIWNILSAHKRKVGVVGYRVTWPAEKVNGIMVSDRVKIHKDAYSSPLYAQPPLNTFCTKEVFDNLDSNLNDPRVSFAETDSFMANIAEYLYKKSRFDFFCLYLIGIDEASHQYWKYMFPENLGLSPEEISKYKDFVPNYYKWCDSVIGRLLKEDSSNKTVIIISDHGFKSTNPDEPLYLFVKVDEFFQAAGLKTIKHNFKEIRLLNMSREEKYDFRKNIRISGDISKEEFTVVRENIKKILGNIKIRENGRPLFQVVDTRTGFVLAMQIRPMKNMPDYHISIGNKEYRLLDFLTRDATTETHDSQDAVIIMSGKNIRRHEVLNNASIYDIVPTTLYLLGLPLARDMQGNILASAISPKLLKENPLKYVDTYENGKDVSSRIVRSPKEEEIIKERLRLLGYIN